MKTRHICIVASLVGIIAYGCGLLEGKHLADHWWERHIIDYLPTIHTEPPPAPYAYVGLFIGDDKHGALDAGAKVGCYLDDGSAAGWTVRDISIDLDRHILQGTAQKAVQP